MKASVDKCQILSTSNDLSVKISEVQIKTRQSEKLPGIINIENNLKFEDHINSICGKASAKNKANNECIL